MIINMVADTSVASAASGFAAAIQQAANIVASSFTDNITLNIRYGWGTFNNVVDNSLTGSGGAYEGNTNGNYVSYATASSWLKADATSSNDLTAIASLSGVASAMSSSTFFVSSAQEKAFGHYTGSANAIDGMLAFGTGIASSSWIPVAIHEITHALGRSTDYYEGDPTILDMFRYGSAGKLQWAGATAAYFSINGGTTDLADYSTTSDYGDLVNNSRASNDPYDAFYSSKTTAGMTALDIEMMDVIGFTTTAPVAPTVIESSGVTTLAQVGSNYFLYAKGTTTGPELMHAGAAVTNGMYGGWVPIGAEKTSTGYEVAWQNGTADQYTIWSTDAAGNYLANVIGVVSGTSTAFESYETSFSQDLNKDGVIGLNLPTTVIEAAGATTLAQVGSNYFLYANGTTTGPELMHAGAAVTNGMYGAWVPIGAEKTSTGYEVAWQNGTADQYTIWSTDAAGNYLANVIGVVSGTSTAFESYETSFSQDLNKDGVTGLNLPTTMIEAAGATTLAQVGSNYFLYANGTTTGPELMHAGAAVTNGMYGAWVPIGGEKTSTGYEVAWQNGTADQYTIWSTDAAGNYLANVIGVVSGTSTAFESYETSFSQDLNKDGVIGLNLPTTVIEAAGATTLAQVGSNYDLYANGTTTGPELTYAGAAVTNGMYGAWVPIGGEKTPTGYEVAWKNGTADQYTIWSTDAAGNYLSNVIGVVPGTSAAFESYETSFSQDLNKDGVIGLNLPTTVIEAAGATTLAQVGSNYDLYANGTTTGPELTYAGAAVTNGMYGAWVPIGGEKTPTGYEVAWKNGSADQYTVWSTDASGNYLSNVIGIVSGTSAGLEGYETSFHQDLNKDGVIGLNNPTAAKA